MRQFEIWWASLPAPIGRRPVLLLSRDAAYDYLHSVLIAEVTTTIRAIPQELALGAREGLSQRCVANFDNLHTVARASLRERAGALPAAKIAAAKRALGYALGWPELTLPE